MTRTSVKPPDLEFTSATALNPETASHVSFFTNGAQPRAGVRVRRAETKTGCSPNYTRCVTVLFYKCLGSWFTASHRPTLGEKSAFGTGPHSSPRQAPRKWLFDYREVFLEHAAMFPQHQTLTAKTLLLLFCTVPCLRCLVTCPWISWWGRPLWPYNADLFWPTNAQLKRHC